MIGRMLTKRMILASVVAAGAIAASVHGGDADGSSAPRRARGQSPDYKKAIQTVEALAKAKSPSIATGTYNDGGLVHPSELPAKGFGYRLASPGRKTHFGTDEMVFGLIELAALIQEKRPGSPWLSVGDISGPEGGTLKPHVNHQDGQDVDLAFLYCTTEGAPVDRGWLKCGADGKTKTPSVVFDVARNFELLVLWLESPYFGGCDWILCYDPLKKLLVEHGRELARKRPKSAEAITKVTDELQKLLREPSSSPHDDHFHIRLKRSPDDRQAEADMRKRK
jgi:hypothetical protein